MHDAAVGGIVGREEVVLVARTGVDVAECQEEAGALQVHVGIDVDPRITPQLSAAVGILLDSKLGKLGQVVGRIVFSEPRNAAAEFDAEHAGNLELQIEV